MGKGQEGQALGLAVPFQFGFPPSLPQRQGGEARQYVGWGLVKTVRRGGSWWVPHESAGASPTPEQPGGLPPTLSRSVSSPWLRPRA
jgi:hypothetical protein